MNAADRKFESRAIAALVLGLLMVLATGWAAHRSVGTLQHMVGDHAEHQAQLAAEQSVSRLRATELAYLRMNSVGDEASVEAFLRHTRELRATLARLDAAMVDPADRATIRRLHRLVEERLEDFEGSGEGHSDVDLESAISQLRESLRHASEHSEAAERHEARLGGFLAAAGTLLSLSLLLWSLAALWRARQVRSAADRQLRESEARHRAILGGMAEAVFTTSTDGTILEVNAAAIQMFGYEQSDFVGRDICELVPQRHREAVRQVVAGMAATKGAIRQQGMEVRCERKDGSRLYVNASFGDVWVGGKRLFVGMLTDVTERRDMVAALHASETQVREIADAMPSLIAYVDADRRIVFHNKAYVDYFGMPSERIRGAALWDILGAEAYAGLEDHIDQVLRGTPVRYERQQRLPTGETRDLAGNLFPRYDPNGSGRITGFYALVHDVTDLKRVDRLKSEFISTVSHELRTPLTSIRGSLGLLSGGVAGKMPAQMAQLVDIAKNNCERLIRLINDMLDIEKIESGKMRFELREESLPALAGQALAALEGFAAHHKVSLRLDARVAPRVRVDADRLAQVVTNLVSNAVKFSPAGAEVTVRVLERDGQARLEVQDRGPGIREEFRRRIFEKFSQADGSDRRLTGGSGLGLNISRAIVDQLGGRIGFTTVEGQGSTFFIELPALVAAPARIIAPATSPRVLVCEDDADVARLIGMMLERAGLAPAIANNAAEARRHLAQGGFSAMTLDIALPGEDGLALLRSLRGDDATRNLPAVIVSAAAREGAVRVGGEDLSVAEWLDKPIDELRLVAAVRGAVFGRAGGCPRILHVEDDPDVRSVAAAIAPEYATVEFSDSLASARAKLAQRAFDLVIVDLELPDGRGEDLAPLLRSLKPTPSTLVFSGHEATRETRNAFDAVLVKARTTNEELAGTIRRLLGMERPPMRAAGD